MKKFIVISSILFVGVFFMLANVVEAATPGDVIITEFMADPMGSDTDKEWIELRNISGGDLNLESWAINDGTNHPITGAHIMTNGSVAVVCKSGDPLLNGGVDCDYTANIVFANTGDTLYLLDTTDSTINSVTYLGANIVEGASRYNDNGWLNESVVMYNATDYGTPGFISGIIIEGKTGDLNGSVELTLLNLNVVLSGTTATVEFNINADSDVIVNYGESDLYGSNVSESILAGVSNIDIINLECDKTYHYKVLINSGLLSVETLDDTFTITCGNIDIDLITMTKTSAQANNIYTDGWQWIFDVTVWNETEDKLQMSFGEWTSGGNTITSADNIRFSVDNGVTWIDISLNNSYSSLVDIIDSDTVSNGTQVQILVDMKVPIGTIVGDYGSQYGIRTE